MARLGGWTDGFCLTGAVCLTCVSFIKNIDKERHFVLRGGGGEVEWVKESECVSLAFVIVLGSFFCTPLPS